MIGIAQISLVDKDLRKLSTFENIKNVLKVSLRYLFMILNDKTQFLDDFLLEGISILVRFYIK